MSVENKPPLDSSSQNQDKEQRNAHRNKIPCSDAKVQSGSRLVSSAEVLIYTSRRMRKSVAK